MPLSGKPQRAGGGHWFTREVARIFVAQTVFGFGWSLYLLIPKFLATALHAGPDAIGRIGAMGGLAALMTVPFAARGLDRWGRRRFFRAAAALVIALSIGFAAVRRVGPLVYLLQGCVGAAFVLAFNASAALLSDYAPSQRLGQAIGWLGAANVLTNALATMAAEPLAARWGWPVVFYLGAAVGCVAFGLSFGLREAVPPAATPARSVVPADGAWHLQLPAILGSTCLMGAVFMAMFGFIQPYALSRGAAEVGGFYLGYTASAVAGRLSLAGLGDRFGRRRVSMWLLLAYGLSTLLVVDLAPDRLVFYGLCFGAVHGLLYPTLNTLVLEVVPVPRRGLGMALYNGAFNFGASVGSVGWGALASALGYPAIYFTSAATALVASVLLLPGRQPRQASAVGP